MNKAIQDLLEQIEGMLDEGLDKQLIWEMLQSTIVSDLDLDALVGILETMEESHQELAEEISIEVSSPTLKSEIETSQPYHSNNRCVQADWQQPRSYKLNEL